MASRERPAPALDADRLDEPPEGAAAAAAEAVETEAAAAEAEARAAVARARAIRLRRQTAQPDDGDTAEPEGTTADTTSGAPLQRRPGKVVAVAAAVVLLSAALAASGYMAWHHRVAAQERQRNAEFAAAAREAVVTFMSLDFNKLEEDIQRISDITTGQFKDRFPIIGDQMAKRVQQSKFVTTATVNDVAVESMTANSAIVLVAATTETKSPDGEQEPQFWHISLGLTEDGGQPKISNIEFVQ
jgi:Mce-associated membrane protein